jgi:hypothetical protein
MSKTIDEIANDLLRIKIIAGTIAAIVLAVTGFTVWQLPFKIQEAVNKKITEDIVNEYRESAKKAALETKQSAVQASQIVKELEEKKSQYSKQLDELTGALARISKTNDALDRINDQLSKLAREVDTKASLDTPYRIKSEKGAFYEAFKEEWPSHGMAMTLGDQSNGSNELALKWRLVKEW